MLIWPPDESPELWSWQPATDADVGVPVPPEANAFAVLKTQLVQRVGASHHVAVLPYKGPAPRAPCADGGHEPRIEELWPEHGVPVDMRATFPPGTLAERYAEAVWGSSPVALFAKQVLAKARSVLAPDALESELRALLVAPEQIEQRYLHDAEVEQRARAHRGELVPVAQVLQQLRQRETQLQVVLGLELLPAAADIEPVLDHHFDRLCIWQAVGGDADTLAEFCSAVVLPFYKSRCPRKTKQFLQRSRGTLKSRSRRPAKDIAAAPSAALPTGGGLLRALQITGSEPAVPPPPQPAPSEPGEPGAVPSLRPSAAVRSASHPLYTMASRQSTVEVRFKRSRKHAPVRAAALESTPPAVPGLPSAPAAAAFTTAAAPVPLQASPPRSAAQSPPPSIPPLPASVEKKVRATPKKERSKFLESLSQPLPIDFDAVESTDSDE